MRANVVGVFALALALGGGGLGLMAATVITTAGSVHGPPWERAG